MAFHRKDKTATIFRTIVILVIVAVVAAVAVVRYNERKAGPDERVPLAECLTEKGVKMYGAYWCPHCQKQKKLFGKAFSKVDYVECAMPGNPQQQIPACQDAGITGYPTWTFANGDRLSGEQPLADLAEKAGCAYGDAVAADEPEQPASEAMPVTETTTEETTIQE